MVCKIVQKTYQLLLHVCIIVFLVPAGVCAIHAYCCRSLDEWYAMVGNSTDDRQLHISRDSGLGVSSPKHGKVCNKHLLPLADINLK